MRLLRAISIADVFTLVNASFGFLAIVAIMASRSVAFDGGQRTWGLLLNTRALIWGPGTPSPAGLAVALILLGILADGFDGIVARRFAQQWVLGDYLDLMADTISFAIAPGLLFLRMLLSLAEASSTLRPEGAFSHQLLMLIVIPALIVLPMVIGTVLRLARFAHSKGGRQVAFRGLPSPASGLVAVLVILMVLEAPPQLQQDWRFFTLVALLPMALCVLMISEIPYPKVRGIEAVVAAVLLLALVGVLLSASGGLLLTWSIAAIAGAHLAYLVGGPLLASFRLPDPEDLRAWEAPPRSGGEQAPPAQQAPAAGRGYVIPPPPSAGLKMGRPHPPTLEEE